LERILLVPLLVGHGVEIVAVVYIEDREELGEQTLQGSSLIDALEDPFTYDFAFFVVGFWRFSGGENSSFKILKIGQTLLILMLNLALYALIVQINSVVKLACWQIPLLCASCLRYLSNIVFSTFVLQH
jgi:hypothetical protein